MKEGVRDVRAGRLLENLSSDVRHAWRMIFKMRLTAVVIILSLGVGIGVNTTIFTWIQAVVFEPLPGVAEGSSFQHVEVRSDTGSYPGMSWLEYRDVRERLGSFRDLLAFRMVPLYVGEAGRTERVYGLLVSGNYFSALGLAPALGRFIQPEEVSRGGEPVVVISYEFWQTRYQSAPNVLGQTVRVNDYPLTIVGVAPKRFQGTVLGLDFSLWTPATLAQALLGGSPELTDRNLRGYAVMGKLQPHETRAKAQAEVDGIMRQLARAYPETNSNMQAEVIPFWLAPRGPQRLLASSLAILQGIMLLLLLAVCANTANLMLARTSTRVREIGVRLSIGAGPWRVASLLLTENMVLAFFGACLGAAIAVWGTEALRAVPTIGAFPIKFQTRVDVLGLAFAMLLGLICGLIFGILPAVQLARINPQLALRTGSGTAATPSRLRNALMGAQVALALMVLVVAALFFRSFRETRAMDPGFRRDGVLLAAYDLTGRSVDTSSDRAFASRLLVRIRALPSVESVAIAASVPLDIHGLPLRAFAVEGLARPNAAQDQALTNTVTKGYFGTMGIPFRAGGDFADLDDAVTPPQAIVNEEFVRRYLKNAEPIGRRIETRRGSYRIAGVVRTSVYESFGERPAPIIYLSYRDVPVPMGEIHIRTRTGAESLLASDVRRIVRELDPTLNAYDIRTMNEHVEKNAMLRRIPAQMFVVLGPLLLILAAIGIYAVVAYSVAQRTAEIGVRLALGASAGQVIGQIVGETLRVVYVGAMTGLLIAFVIDIHVARGAIYLPAFVGVPVILMLVAAGACWIPAHRVSRVDPMVALRHE